MAHFNLSALQSNLSNFGWKAPDLSAFSRPLDFFSDWDTDLFDFRARLPDEPDEGGPGDGTSDDSTLGSRTPVEPAPAKNGEVISYSDWAPQGRLTSAMPGDGMEADLGAWAPQSRAAATGFDDDDAFHFNEVVTQPRHTITFEIRETGDGHFSGGAGFGDVTFQFWDFDGQDLRRTDVTKWDEKDDADPFQALFGSDDEFLAFTPLKLDADTIL